MLEHKFHRPEAGLSLAVLDGGTRVVSGYASLFGVRDQGGDVVQKGAYRASLERKAGKHERIKMLWQHDPGQPIGIWEEVHEDARGLWVKGRLLTEVERGREAAALLEVGAIDGLSIGYRTVRAERDARGQRVLHEIDLWEVSLVTFPMLPEARVAAKAGDADLILSDLAELFHEARRELAARTGDAIHPSEPKGAIE